MKCYLQMVKCTEVMPCSLCKKTGHNKLTCPTKETVTKTTVTKKTATKKIAVTNTAISPPSEMAISQFLQFISTVKNDKISLLRQKEVVQWLFGDLSFLPAIEKKNKSADEACYKIHEDKWGQTMLKKIRRPDLKLDKQWTNKFGEHLCEEIYTLHGQTVSKPVKKEHFQPDLEVADAILEVKTGTFHTAGTAGEKILGCPFKYADIPILYGKPLKILCLGGAEKACRESYGNLPGPTCSAQKNKFLEFFRENQIEYVGVSDLLRSLHL